MKMMTIRIKVAIFLAVVLLVGVSGFGLPNVQTYLLFFEGVNFGLGGMFLFSLLLKLNAKRSLNKKSPIGTVALSFFIKLLGGIVLLLLVFLLGGKSMMLQLRYVFLALFALYTLLEMAFLVQKNVS